MLGWFGRMNIQVVCQHYYPEQYPLTRICPELAGRGHTVHVLTGLPNYPEGYIYKGYRGLKNRRQLLDGVEVIRCPLIPRGKSKAGLFLNYISFALSGMFRALFLKKDFDAILVIQSSPVTMAMPGMVLKALTKKPLYIYTFDLWPESLVSGGVLPGSFIYRTVGRLSRRIYRSADKIFVSSRRFKQYFETVHGISGNIYDLPFYMDDVFFGAEPAAEKDSATTNLVFAGNIGQMQSVDTIVKAAKMLENENVGFHIVGDGSARQACEALAKEISAENIKFYGRMDFSKMPGIYAMADAMLVTLADNDLISYTLPNKVLSYMAAGKPVIACANGETADVIQSAACGFTCPAQDADGLAGAVKAFIRADNKKQMAENARKFYLGHYTIDIFIENLKSLTGLS